MTFKIFLTLLVVLLMTTKSWFIVLITKWKSDTLFLH